MKLERREKKMWDHKCEHRYSVTSLSIIIFLPKECQKKKRGERGRRLFEEIIVINFSDLGTETHLDPGGMENSHQSQQKQANTKTL